MSLYGKWRDVLLKNKYEIKGNEVHIEINHKGNLLVTTIDKEDLDIVDSFEGTWYGSKYKDRSTIYVTGTDHNGGDRISLKLHRLIANPKENELVDHKDGNGLNNTKDNLRTCDYKENARNTRVTRNNTSGSVGVSYRKDRRKWRAYITIDGKQKS